MPHTYELTQEPILVHIGKGGGGTVKSSIPFFVGSALHCANYVHRVGSRNRPLEVFQGIAGSPSGVLKVWPG